MEATNWPTAGSSASGRCRHKLRPCEAQCQHEDAREGAQGVLRPLEVWCREVPDSKSPERGEKEKTDAGLEEAMSLAPGQDLGGSNQTEEP